MSDTENVSAEVRELLELVLNEPSIQSETKNVISSTNQEENIIPEAEDKTIQSIDADQSKPVNSNDDQQSTIIQSENDNSQTTQPSQPDLRVIESNALKLIAQYGSDSDSEESPDESESSDDVVAVDDVNDVLQKTITDGNYRVVSSDSDESTSSDDSDVEVISIQNEIINLDDDIDEELDQKPRGPIRAEGEFSIDSLPPIEDLKISVPEDECVVLGKVMSIVDQLVVVDSLPKSVPIDIDSVLFLDKGTKPLGHVFDVLGNISSPMYCVRFNSNKQIQEKGITVGTPVYVAPRTEHTSFVVVSELMKQKGCDASWKNDIEPLNAQDFSDDEEERKARRMRRGRSNSTNESETVESSVSPAPATTQHGNNRGNNRRNAHRTPRRRGGNFNRGGHNYDRNYGPPVQQHSWHQNLPQSNWNQPMMRHNNGGPMGPFPQSLLLPPPPPPPPSNSYW